jgi:negative regulator of flagellin synthesis FlgM
MTININNSNIQQLHKNAVSTLTNNVSANNGQAKNIDGLNTKNVNSKLSSVNPAKESADSVTLTDSALNLKKLEESISHLPIVDMKKVEEIQNKIKDGSYSINPDKIAQRFIEMELALSS